MEKIRTIQEEILAPGREIPVPLFIEELTDKVEQILKKHPELKEKDIRIGEFLVDGEYEKHCVVLLHYDT